MRIVVTGAGGFIGRALCRALAASGHEAVACVRRRVPDIEGAEIRPVADITDRDGLQDAMRGAEMVAHLAGRAHVLVDDAADPLSEYRRVNVDGTRAVMDAAGRADVRRVVFLSSAKVNGERTDGRPFTENDAPNPEDAYGISKHEAEGALFDGARRTGIEAVCLRPPLVYGPGVGANFATLLRACDSAIPLPFASVTENRRSMICLGNLVSATIAALTHSDAAGRTFLVRDGEDLSTARLISRLRNALCRPARLFPVPPPVLRNLLRLAGKGAMADRLLGSLAIDDRAIRDALSWTPPYAIDDAFAETADWFRGARSGNRGAPHPQPET